MSEIARRLSEPFAKQLIKRDPRGLSYVPVAEVVARMNAVCGVGGWSVEVLKTEPWGEVATSAGPAPAHIVALVRVTIEVERDRQASFEAFGGQDVGFFKPDAKTGISKGPLNLGDAYKGACSDAMKKALQHAGVALELARDDDAIAATAPPACSKCGEILVDASVESKRQHMVSAHGYQRLPDGRVAPASEEAPLEAKQEEEEQPILVPVGDR